MKNNLLKTLFLSSILCTASSIQAQNVGIGTNNPSPSAKLDITDTQKGILIPRVNIANLNTAAPVTSPVVSLLVYNTNTTTGVGFYYWDGSQWQRINDQTSSDADWFGANTTTSPNSINDNIFTQGSVGIGTTNPLATLDVFGDIAINRTQLGAGGRPWMVDGIRVGNSSDNAYFGLKNEGANNADAVIAWGDDSGDHLRFIKTNSGGPVDGEEYMRITDFGNVGIGTNDPQAKLEVKAGAENQTGPVEAIRIWGPNSPANSNSAQDLNFQFAVAGSAGIRAYRGTSWDTYLQFYTNNDLTGSDNPEVHMTLDDEGRLGVGTTSPLALTHISSETTGDAVLRVEADTDDNNEDDNPRVELYQDGGQTGTMMGFFDGGFLGGNIFRIGTRFGNINDWATLTINTDNKNVGIGTASPSDRLQVAGNARVGLINPANTTTFPQDGNRLYFSGTTAGISNSENTDPIYINRHNSAGDQSQLRVNVGDNTQAQDALVVGYTSGGFQERIRLQTDGNALKPGGGTWSTLSDRRTKKEITPFEDGLNVLTKINPVTFKYNGLYNTVDDDQNHVGIIAQEVQPIAPYMIGTQTTEQQELLNYDGGTYMIYILVNAVKQQQQQLETTTQENKTLQAEINTLKQTNATMTSKLSELETLKAEVQAIKELLNSNAQK